MVRKYYKLRYSHGVTGQAGELTSVCCCSAVVPPSASVRSRCPRWSPAGTSADCWLPPVRLIASGATPPATPPGSQHPPPFPFPSPHFRLPSCWCERCESHVSPSDVDCLGSCHRLNISHTVRSSHPALGTVIFPLHCSPLLLNRLTHLIVPGRNERKSIWELCSCVMNEKLTE